MNETISIPLNLPRTSGGSTLPAISRPRRLARRIGSGARRVGSGFRRLGSGARRVASAGAGRVRAAASRVRTSITQRFRRRRQASAAARASGTGRSTMRWGKAAVVFLVGAVAGMAVQTVMQRLGYSPLTSGIVIAVIGLTMFFVGAHGGFVRVAGAGMAFAGAASVVVYEVRKQPITSWGQQQPAAQVPG